MFFSPKKKAVLGLDIGSSSVKGVQLELKDNEIKFKRYERLTLFDQGILNDSEFCHTIQVWLEQNNWKEIAACAALPQYLATVNVRDFPATANSEHLMGSMINYETQQLSGISEENFINDYHIMPPAFGRENPVLIGICKESVIEEKINILEDIHLNLLELTIDSIALANAIFTLHPNLKKDPNPHLVLDIGADSSTGIIIAQGQILYIGSLMSGISSFEKEIADSKKIIEDNEQPLKIIRKDPGSGTRSSLENVKAELKNLIDHWHDLENSDLSEADISKIWVCGGGFRIKGLDEFLHDEFKCPVESFGPQDPDTGEMLPDMVVAYGLAIMGLERGEVSISLCPENIQWVNRRKKNFSFLVAACLFLIISVFLYLCGQFITLSITDHLNQAEMTKLNKCNSLIPKLEDTVEDIKYHRKMMIPFVVKGNSSNRFVAAFKEIAKVTGPEHFFIYIADGETFQEGKKLSTGGKNKNSSGLNASFFNSESKANITLDKTNYKVVDEMSEIDAIVLVGYTLCSTNKQHYNYLRQIQKNLDQSSLFEKVDLLPEDQIDSRSDIFGAWKKNVVNNRAIRRFLRRKRFRAFGIRMPFADKNLKIKPPKAEKKK